MATESKVTKRLRIAIPPTTGAMRLTGTLTIADWLVEIDVPFSSEGDVVAALRLTADRLEKEGYK